MRKGLQLSFPWQEPLLKYLGSGGRVKTIRLRGEVSTGILLRPSEKFDDFMAELLNVEIQKDVVGETYLEKVFGVKHWSAPSRQMQDGSMQPINSNWRYFVWDYKSKYGEYHMKISEN